MFRSCNNGILCLRGGRIASHIFLSLFSVLLCISPTFIHPQLTLAADSSGVWQQVGSLSAPRYSGIALGLLQDGRAILVGGFDHIPSGPWTSADLSKKTEIYDPVSKTWSLAGDLNMGRALYQSPKLITLSDGRVLVANGENPGVVGLSEAELFDPSTGSWTVVASTNTGRYRNIIAPLPGGKVLTATGSTFSGSRTATAEIYDPDTNTWSYTTSLHSARDGEEIALALADGRVMVAGGYTGGSDSDNTAEIYDPITAEWTLSTMPYPMQSGSLTQLQDGRVLLVGGWSDSARGFVTSTGLYDPTTNSWVSAAPLPEPRAGHNALLLADGKVMVFGGRADGVLYATTRIYDPATNTWSQGPSLPQGVNELGAIQLQNGDILAAGGYFDGAILSSSAYLFTSATRQLSALSPAAVWVGLKNSDGVGVKFDLKAEVYKNGTALVGSGVLNGVPGGSSGFNHARLNTIPLTLPAPVDFPGGTTLSIKVYVRNTCFGNTRSSGTARLWYNDTAANSQFGAAVDTTANTYYLRDAFALSTTPGPGPKKTIDVAAGAPCSAYKLFGTWSITP